MQIRLHHRYKTANGFQTRRNYYHILRITLILIKYLHSYLCQECGGYREEDGRIEVDSFLPKRRERTLAVRFEVVKMLEVKEDRWFGRLDDDSPKVKRMRRVYPRVDYTQAPWTIVILRQPSQSIHTLREA